MDDIPVKHINKEENCSKKHLRNKSSGFFKSKRKSLKNSFKRAKS